MTKEFNHIEFKNFSDIDLIKLKDNIDKIKKTKDKINHLIILQQSIQLLACFAFVIFGFRLAIQSNPISLLIAVIIVIICFIIEDNNHNKKVLLHLKKKYPEEYSELENVFHKLDYYKGLLTLKTFLENHKNSHCEKKRIITNLFDKTEDEDNINIDYIFSNENGDISEYSFKLPLCAKKYNINSKTPILDCVTGILTIPWEEKIIVRR